MRKKLLKHKRKFFLSLMVFFSAIFAYNAQKQVAFSDREFSSLLIHGTGAKISGDLYTADSLYKECLKLNPKSGVVNFELSGIYQINENYEKAIAYALKAVQYSPKNEWYLANLALLYKLNEEHSQSADIFKLLCEIQPKKIPYLFSLTEEYLASRKYKKSIRILNKIEAEIGINEELSIQKHQIYLFTRKKKKALKELEKLVANSPGNIRNIGLLAEYYETINKGGKSIPLLQKMMEIDSSNGLVRLSMFQHYYRKGEYKKGFIELQNVINSSDVEEQLKKEILIQISYDKNSPYTLLNVDNLTRIFLDFYPKNSEMLLFYGNLKFLQYKDDSACVLLRKSLSINSLPFDVWTQLISSSLSRGKYEETIQDAENAIESHPNQPFPFFAKGIALSALKKHDLSLQILFKGKLLVIDDAILESDFYHQIADAQYAIEDYKNAFVNYENAINLNPNNSLILNNYSYYLALQKENLTAAESLIIKAIEMMPNSATYYDTYGWVLFQKGEYKVSEEKLFKAVMLSQEKNGEILEHYGDVMYMLQKEKEALLFWDKALKPGAHSENLLKKIDEKKYTE